MGAGGSSTAADMAASVNEPSAVPDKPAKAVLQAVSEIAPARHEKASNKQETQADKPNTIAAHAVLAKTAEADALKQQPAQTKPDVCKAAGHQVEMTLEQLSNENWWQLVEVLSIAGVSKSIALSCSVAQLVKPNALTLTLDETQATLYNEQHKSRIESSLSDYFSHPVTLQIQIAAVTAETPAQRKLRIAAQQLEQAKALIADDPFVKALEVQMGAQVLPDSISYYCDDSEV